MSAASLGRAPSPKRLAAIAAYAVNIRFSAKALKRSAYP
jgi:hypothetical protein